MITDANLTLAINQAPTVTAVSTNTIDLGVSRDVGAGDELHILVFVKVQPTSAGAATVNFQAITSAIPNLSSPKILGQTDAIPIASLVVGSIVHIPVPRNYPGTLGQRYLGLQYNIAIGPLTGGSFDVFVVHDLTGLPPGTVYPAQQNVK